MPDYGHLQNGKRGIYNKDNTGDSRAAYRHGIHLCAKEPQGKGEAVYCGN